MSALEPVTNHGCCAELSGTVSVESLRRGEGRGQEEEEEEEEGVHARGRAGVRVGAVWWRGAWASMTGVSHLIVGASLATAKTDAASYGRAWSSNSSTPTSRSSASSGNHHRDGASLGSGDVQRAAYDRKHSAARGARRVPTLARGHGHIASDLQTRVRAARAPPLRRKPAGSLGAFVSVRQLRGVLRRRGSGYLMMESTMSMAAVTVVPSATCTATRVQN